MQVPGLERPAIARVISLPDDEGLALNKLVLKRGRMPNPDSTDEAVALKSFLDAAHVKLGDRLSTTLEGRRIAFTIVGAVMSPEYVYAPSPESMMPDDAHQGVFWAPRRAVEKVEGLGGAFDAVSLKLAPGASSSAVRLAVDEVLRPYGGTSAYARKDQPSHYFLEAEFKELSTSASVIPPVFLIVAAVLVHLVMGRLVDVDREQIGLLKAFGYRDLEAASVYLRMAGVIGLVGALGGALAGAAFGAAVVDLYARYFRFPELRAGFSWPAFAATSALSVGMVMAGSIFAVRRASALSPAVAMQPPRPPAYRRGLLERIGLIGALDQPTRMMLRSLQRFPVRAALTAAGLASSLVLLIGTQFLFDALDQILDHAYYRAHRSTHVVGFAEARDPRALMEARRLPGVYAAEPMRTVAARVRAGGAEERVAVTGLQPGALMTRALDKAGRPIPFEGRGVILSDALAGRLNVKLGDVVDVELMEGRRPSLALPVTAVAEDYSGFAIYMDRAELNRALGDGDLASGAQLLARPDAQKGLYRAIEAAPLVVAASSRDDLVANWRLAMTEAFRINIVFYVGFAGAIAFGVAYNALRIALAERSRDLATLHVLGFKHADCAYVLLGELFLLALLAVPLGVLGGNALVRGLTEAYSRNELRLPAVVSAASYGTAFTVYGAVLIAAAAIVGRRIWTLDLVAVLKTRE